MPSNKNRLYVALYARGGARTMPGLEDQCVMLWTFNAITFTDMALLDTIGACWWVQR